MNNRARRIKQIYQQNTIFNQLTNHAKLITKLNQVFTQSLPLSLIANCRLVNIKNNILIIHADNAATATLIRYQAKQLCKTFSNQMDATIADISVKVRPVSHKSSKTHTHKLELSSTSAEIIVSTAKGLNNPELSAALTKLARRNQN